MNLFIDPGGKISYAHFSPSLYTCKNIGVRIEKMMEEANGYLEQLHVAQ
jgi:hypothetical protein